MEMSMYVYVSMSIPKVMDAERGKLFQAPLVTFEHWCHWKRRVQPSSAWMVSVKWQWLESSASALNHFEIILNTGEQ